MITVQPKLDRIGETKLNNFGSKMLIIEYNNARNITVQFEDGYTKKTEYSCFSKGQLASPYEKRIHHVGFLGEGSYNFYDCNKAYDNYIIWKGMITRCYSLKFQDEYTSYKGCTVQESWHNFQNFAKWYDDNYYKIDNENICLDKDILVKGNKLYSPETCCFVPQIINNLFIKNNKLRGKYPIGVSFRRNSYSASCNNIKGNRISLGIFDSILEAFNAYKIAKENYIKEIAEQYKNRIPEKVYKALLNYQVEITD